MVFALSNLHDVMVREICGQNLVETVSVRCVRDNVWYIHIDVYIYIVIYIYIYTVNIYIYIYTVS
jgi:hypothetical protein